MGTPRHQNPLAQKPGPKPKAAPWLSRETAFAYVRESLELTNAEFIELLCFASLEARRIQPKTAAVEQEARRLGRVAAGPRAGDSKGTARDQRRALSAWAATWLRQLSAKELCYSTPPPGAQIVLKEIDLSGAERHLTEEHALVRRELRAFQSIYDGDLSSSRARTRFIKAMRLWAPGMNLTTIICLSVAVDFEADTQEPDPRAREMWREAQPARKLRPRARKAP